MIYDILIKDTFDHIVDQAIHDNQPQVIYTTTYNSPPIFLGITAPPPTCDEVRDECVKYTRTNMWDKIKDLPSAITSSITGPDVNTFKALNFA